MKKAISEIVCADLLPISVRRMGVCVLCMIAFDCVCVGIDKRRWVRSLVWCTSFPPKGPFCLFNICFTANEAYLHSHWSLIFDLLSVGSFGASLTPSELAIKAAVCPPLLGSVWPIWNVALVKNQRQLFFCSVFSFFPLFSISTWTPTMQTKCVFEAKQPIFWNHQWLFLLLEIVNVWIWWSGAYQCMFALKLSALSTFFRLLVPLPGHIDFP